MTRALLAVLAWWDRVTFRPWVWWTAAKEPIPDCLPYSDNPVALDFWARAGHRDRV